MTVRVAASTGSSDTVKPTEWTGKALPPRVAGFQKDFITKYMDPTETYARMDSLTAQFPDIMQAVPLPHKTDGYQRQGMAMMAGTTDANANPNAANTPLAVQLFSKAQGHLGGNNITAEFKNPGAPKLAAVDHGDRRHVARGRSQPTRTPPTGSARSSSRSRTSWSTSPRARTAR